MKTPDSKFYVGLNPNYKPGSDISWFMNSAMGKNKLGTIAKVMSEKPNCLVDILTTLGGRQLLQSNEGMKYQAFMLLSWLDTKL
jgi:hypothetical protein